MHVERSLFHINCQITLVQQFIQWKRSVAQKTGPPSDGKITSNVQSASSVRFIDIGICQKVYILMEDFQRYFCLSAAYTSEVHKSSCITQSIWTAQLYYEII